MITFHRAIYDLQGFVTGAVGSDGSNIEEELKELTKEADKALYREPGYFFKTVEFEPPVFVFGFLNIESNRGEAFFNLFITELNNIVELRFQDIRDELAIKNREIGTRHDPIQDSVSVGISRSNFSNANQRDSGYSSGLTNSQPTNESDNQTSSDFENENLNESSFSSDDSNSFSSDDAMGFDEIAGIWERYRRGIDPVWISLRDLDRFVSVVSNASENISFVSNVPERGNPAHFDFAGGAQTEQIDSGTLAKRLSKKTTLKELSWEDLPTYEEEYQNLRTKNTNSLKEAHEYNEQKAEFTEWLESEIEQQIEKPHERHAVDTFQDALDSTIDGNQNDGLIDIREMITGGGPDENHERLISRSAKSVDEETQKAIIENLGQPVEEILQERVKKALLPEIESRLQTMIEQQIETYIKETIRHTDIIKSSKAYEEGRDSS